MYKISAFSALIHKADDETRKRYSLIEKLSQGFTKEHPLAREMDSLLAQQFELESNNTREIQQPVTKRSAKASKPSPDGKDVQSLFTDLFNALRQQSNVTVDEEAVKEILVSEVRRLKIGLDNLSDDLKAAFLAQPKIIKYEIPQTTTTSFAEPPIASFQQIIDDILLGANVMLIGGAGTGKTYLAEYLVAKMALGRQHVTINCSQWTSPTEIIGGQTMDGYVEGKLIEAWTNGHVLILDEMPKLDPNTAGLFNDALAKTKITNAVIFNARKESFVKHQHFACIATGNVYPDRESSQYSANNKQDGSLLDRFSGCVYIIEKNPDIERRILQNDMVWGICDSIRASIEELKYEAQLSLRFMIHARDAYNLEMERFQSRGRHGIEASSGKTFKAAVDSYLSTFTSVQQENIRQRMSYRSKFDKYQYRQFDKNKIV